MSTVTLYTIYEFQATQIPQKKLPIERYERPSVFILAKSVGRCFTEGRRAG